MHSKWLSGSDLDDFQIGIQAGGNYHYDIIMPFNEEYVRHLLYSRLVSYCISSYIAMRVHMHMYSGY